MRRVYVDGRVEAYACKHKIEPQTLTPEMHRALHYVCVPHVLHLRALYMVIELTTVEQRRVLHLKYHRLTSVILRLLRASTNMTHQRTKCTVEQKHLAKAWRTWSTLFVHTLHPLNLFLQTHVSASSPLNTSWSLLSRRCWLRTFHGPSHSSRSTLLARYWPL